MELDRARAVLTEQSRAVLATRRRDGTVVRAGPDHAG